MEIIKIRKTKAIKKIICDAELKVARENLNKTRKKYDELTKRCEEEIYGYFVNKYFNKKEDNLTHLDLLKGLQKYYKYEKKQDINYNLGMQQFIEKFPQKTATIGTNYKRQHVFEALCRLLLFLNYDKGDLGFGKRKKFYKSLETYIAGTRTLINDDILESKVNEGSGAGIVDIFFKCQKNKLADDLWACDYKTSEEKSEEISNEFIMIQNKYYDKEKSNISNYDVTRIYSLSDLTHKETQVFSGAIPTIILMVNNEAAVSHNLSKAKQQYPHLLDSKRGILGVKTLNNWFQEMLFELLTSKDIDSFLTEKKSTTITEKVIQSRFHQKYFISCTLQSIDQGINKFIWGAVPRSGKSYMIGDLIYERKNTKNDVVLILGAKTETLSQFKKMFKEFKGNFKDYEVLDPDSSNKEGKLNIYLFSQEYLKKNIDNINDKSNSVFNAKIKLKYPKLFEKGKIDLYFDEIHKGGSTDKSENIINSFYKTDIAIDIFVMVTATFAKPTLKYDELNFIGLGKLDTTIIEWSYNDQQNMKYIVDDTKKEMMIHTKQEGLQRDVLSETFDYYQQYYGLDYLNILASEYKKYPELVLISPQSIQLLENENPSIFTKYETDDMRNILVKNLKCTACEPSKEVSFYQNPNNIFKQIEPINDLLEYIHGIYQYFQSELDYSIGKTHTELWFLPDKNLYETNSECRDICREVLVDDNMDIDIDNEKQKGIANIEPLTRGLAISICKSKNFKNYNILIVHNTKLTYLGTNIKEKNLFNDSFNNRIKLFNNSSETSLSDQIKKFENESYRNNKSLIILTGAKLRLGISLPCADIAFNFDDIKSVDNNYQTMFRVLTERQDKKYGYYVDLNKNRSIQFVYEYNKNYGEAKKSNVKEQIEALKSLLFTFNYNGLNLIKSDTSNELQLYSHLITDLQLNEKEYAKFWSSNKNIIDLINTNFSKNKELLKNFLKVVNVVPIKKQNITKKLKEGVKKVDIAKIGNEKQGHQEQEQQEQQEKELDYVELGKAMAQNLCSVVCLLAISSNDVGYECDNVINCLHLQERQLTIKCSCKNIERSNIIDCFFNSPVLTYSTTQMREILKKYKELISEDTELQENLNFIFDNIKSLMSGNALIYDMSEEDIEDKIQKNLAIKEEEKNKFGEVFTPISLINEILNELEHFDKDIFSNPNLTWLDPANGIGNFPILVYKRLMKGLEIRFKDKKKRHDHIIKNMLYMIEINPKNVKISKKIFGTDANICCGDFLSDKCFEGMNFDVIIGNPPFQKDKVNKLQGGYGGRTLWDKFVVKIFNILNTNGYLAFITPPEWRKPENNLYELMTNQNQLLYLHIYGERQGQEKFHVSQRFDLYIIQHKHKYKNTKIVDELNDSIELNLTNWPFLPNYDYNTISHIITTEQKGIKIIYSSTLYETRKEYICDKKQNAVCIIKNPQGKIVRESPKQDFKYPVVHSINQSGIVFWYSSDNTKGHFGIPKVLLNFNRNQYPVNDFDGDYGMSQITFGIPITSRKQGDEIVKAINTDAFKEIIKATKWGAFQTDWRMFKYFKPDFYKYFLQKSPKTKKIAKVITLSLEKESTLKSKTPTKDKKERAKTKTTQKFTKAKGHKKDNKTKKRGNNKTKKIFSYFKLW